MVGLPGSERATLTAKDTCCQSQVRSVNIGDA